MAFVERREFPQHNWVLFRDTTAPSSTQLQYGQVYWHPGDIPNGNRILIDVTGTNAWLRSLSLAFRLEIRPYQPQSTEDQLSGIEIDGKGTAAMVQAARLIKPRQPELSIFSGDPKTDDQTVFINFSGILDWIKSQKPNLSDKDLYRSYAYVIDQALNDRAKEMILFNYLSTTKEYSCISTNYPSNLFLLLHFFRVFAVPMLESTYRKTLIKGKD